MVSDPGQFENEFAPESGADGRRIDGPRGQPRRWSPRRGSGRPHAGRLLLERMEERTLLSGTITGLAFEDYNANGTYDTTSTIANASAGTIGVAVDRGIASVTVTAYDNAGVARGTATTAADGTYSLGAAGTGPYRVVFTNLPAGTTEGPEGPNSGSSVQVVPDGNSSNVSLGVSISGDYNPNNPLIAANQYIYGDPIGGSYANNPTLLGFSYSAGSQYGAGDDSQPSTFAFSIPAKAVGATFGLGFNQASGTLYASSFTKRFAGYGPNATGTGTTDGAIYAINPTTGEVSTLADLNTIFGANTAGVDFRGQVGWAGYATDGGNLGWDSVGKTPLGGLAVSPDGSTVYVMNLADRNLYAIPTSGPINSTTVRHVSIPFNAPGATGIAGGDLRPFAVTYYNGQLYVGMVNSAQTTQNKADLKAYVYAVDPTTLAFGAAPVFQASLNYARGISAVFGGSGNPSANWNPWSSTFQTLGANTTASYAQPMLTGIAFDASGNMVLGLRDRSGDETGFFTDANAANPTKVYEGIAAGDTLRAFANTPGNVGGGWTLENDGRGPAGQGAGPQNTNLGPGGRPSTTSRTSAARTPTSPAAGSPRSPDSTT